MGYLRIDEEKHVVFKEIDGSKVKRKDLLKISLNPGFLAFVINGTYDQEKGLLLKRGEMK